MLSERYKQVYVELTELRGRSERDINALKEHLKLTDAALEEGRLLGNSTNQWEHSKRSNQMDGMHSPSLFGHVYTCAMWSSFFHLVVRNYSGAESE